jgi:predicted nucleic acid-binding protein
MSNFGPTSTTSQILGRKIGTSGRRVLIDTSVAVCLNETEFPRLLPWLAASTLTVAELARGPHRALDELEMERRRRHLRQVESKIELLPFDLRCARAYGLVSAAVEQAGRKARGSRSIDLMIAATAFAYYLPLYTLNPKDVRGLEDLIEIIDVG